MEVALLGIDHSKVAIQDMEPIFLNKDGKQAFRKAFNDAAHMHELVVLTTCNRIEFYFVADNMQRGAAWIISQLAKQKQVDESLVKSLLIPYEQAQALQHLFEVSSGIQSMVFGENEILSQVKEAYENASKEATAGTYLNKCFQAAIACGKRARSETLISRGAYSVSSIAIDAIRQTKLDYFADNILVIGMGVMGKRCVKKCDALGHPSLTVCNRSIEKAQQMAAEHNCDVIAYEQGLKQLQHYDIIITATSTKEAVIRPDMLSDNTQLLVDLGLPRNIDPAIADLKNKELINVDGLKKVALKNIKRKEEEISKVQAIINEEKERVFHWMSFKQKCQNN